MRAEILKMP